MILTGDKFIWSDGCRFSAAVNLIPVTQMDGCPFSEPAFSYVAPYLFIPLFIYLLCCHGSAVKPAFLSGMCCQGESFFPPETVDYTGKMWSLRLFENDFSA